MKVWCHDSIVWKLVVLSTEQGVLKSPPCSGWLVNALSHHGARHFYPVVGVTHFVLDGTKKHLDITRAKTAQKTKNSSYICVYRIHGRVPTAVIQRRDRPKREMVRFRTPVHTA